MSVMRSFRLHELENTHLVDLSQRLGKSQTHIVESLLQVGHELTEEIQKRNGLSESDAYVLAKSFVSRWADLMALQPSKNHKVDTKKP